MSGIALQSQGDVLESGFGRFSRLWHQQAGRLVSKRLEGALGRRIRCGVPRGEVLDIVIVRNSVRVEPMSSEDAPHAILSMNSEDWIRVLSGDLHLMSIALAGRMAFPKDQRRLIMQFSILLQATMLTDEGES